VSRDDVAAEDTVDPLRGAFAQYIRECVAGMPSAQALQVADGLCSIAIVLLAGRRVTFKDLPAIDTRAITESWRKGCSLHDVMKTHKCSRATAYRHQPKKHSAQVVTNKG